MPFIYFLRYENASGLYDLAKISLHTEKKAIVSLNVIDEFEGIIPMDFIKVDNSFDKKIVNYLKVLEIDEDFYHYLSSLDTISDKSLRFEVDKQKITVFAEDNDMICKDFGSNMKFALKDTFKNVEFIDT